MNWAPIALKYLNRCLLFIAITIALTDVLYWLLRALFGEGEKHIFYPLIFTPLTEKLFVISGIGFLGVGGAFVVISILSAILSKKIGT